MKKLLAIGSSLSALVVLAYMTRKEVKQLKKSHPIIIS